MTFEQRNEPCEYLEKEYFRQSEQRVQMSRDGNVLVICLRNNNEISVTEAQKIGRGEWEKIMSEYSKRPRRSWKKPLVLF